MLKAVSVVVLQGRDDDLPPLPPGGLQLEQGRGRRLPPLGQEDDEGERLEGVLQQALEVGNRSVHQLFAERRVGLEGAVVGLELEDWPKKIEGVLMQVAAKMQFQNKYVTPTNIGIARGTVPVATIVVVSAGVDI